MEYTEKEHVENLLDMLEYENPCNHCPNEVFIEPRCVLKKVRL